MCRADKLYELSEGLPVPTDDGACDHLLGMRLPPVALPFIAGENIDLSEHSGKTAVYCYPRTGSPGEDLPREWDGIPGARGCTLQPCAFWDHHAELQALRVRVFGLSTQSTVYQREAADRLLLPPSLSSAMKSSPSRRHSACQSSRSRG